MAETKLKQLTGLLREAKEALLYSEEMNGRIYYLPKLQQHHQWDGPQTRNIEDILKYLKDDPHSILENNVDIKKLYENIFSGCLSDSCNYIHGCCAVYNGDRH